MSQHTHECADCGAPLDGTCILERDDEAGGRGVCVMEDASVQCLDCAHAALLERVAAFNAARVPA